MDNVTVHLFLLRVGTISAMERFCAILVWYGVLELFKLGELNDVLVIIPRGPPKAKCHFRRAPKVLMEVISN